MKSISRAIAAFVLAGGMSVVAQETEAVTGLTARIVVLKDMGESNRPVRTTSFKVDDTAYFAFAAQGVTVEGGKTVRLTAGWEVIRPNGEPLRMQNTALQTSGFHPDDPTMMMLKPTPGITFRMSEPTGCYRVRLAVTDLVSKATAEVETPIFVFITEGAKNLVPEPEPRKTTAMDEIILDKGFWATPLDIFGAKTWAAGFNWTDTDRNGLRSAEKQAMTFMGQSVVEVKLDYKDNHPGEVFLSLYNRGDVGPIDNEDFTNRVTEVVNRFRTICGRSPQSLAPPVSSSAAKYKSFILVWKRDLDLIRMEYAWSMIKAEGAKKRGMQPEYINLSIVPGSNAVVSVTANQKVRVAPGSLAKNVKRLPDGDVFIDGVPMVDQGEKGYCAAAAAERVMEYYGTDVDQHEMAQRMAMGTGGVKFEDMVKGFRSVAQALGLQLKMLIEMDDGAIMRMIDDYNKMAKKMNKPPLDLSKLGKQNLYGKKTLWDLMDKDVFLASRTRERIAIERFFGWVQEKIELGIPLCNGVVIGILPEEAELGQPSGGHLRLIIGYNAKTSEVLYTDSWGPGHERKRMPLNHSFAITTGLFTLEPK